MQCKTIINYQFSRYWASILLGSFFGVQIQINLHLKSRRMYYSDGGGGDGGAGGIWAHTPRPSSIKLVKSC